MWRSKTFWCILNNTTGKELLLSGFNFERCAPRNLLETYYCFIIDFLYDFFKHAYCFTSLISILGGQICYNGISEKFV